MATGYNWAPEKYLESKSKHKYGDILQSAMKTDSFKHDHGNSFRKRRHDDDYGKVGKPQSQPARPIQRSKRIKTPRIIGQALPVSRVVEVLDHRSLQQLLTKLLSIHPEVATTINKLSPRTELKDCLETLRERFDEIINHLPYKCDVESDYSYLRVKPHLNEFLSCLSDLTLSFLPPIETNTIQSLTFLDYVTTLIHQLPNFANTEFQYTKVQAYDQLANTWIIAFNHSLNEDDCQEVASTKDAKVESLSKIVKMIEDNDLINKLEKHNELSQGKFRMVIELVKATVDNYQSLSDSLGAKSLLGDMFTVDYSNFVAAQSLN
ncbi:Tethering factor for nuclear proteasome STS1 [Meyerozyma sp. JA9]|nr:Tethering factor for nuclear proteasome STS1 [Meyerozyma sp. JA9]